ncbi:MAG: uroporphyrinogen decarboxylase family protein [Eubacteriales bacterium]|nr:uroporphyrinogen decarboxylase family protein [Eubacteriales bacterium]
MSYKDGWAAINLNMPDRVPRTEYSAASHWELVKTVTGIDVNSKSPGPERVRAANAFKREWNYDLEWNILINNREFGDVRTKMGHATYASGGTDYDNQISCPFHDDIVWTEGAIFHPEWYRKYVFPNYKKYLAPLLESGKKVLFTSDGCYTEFIDEIAATGVHGFVMEPITDMKYIAEKYGKTHVFVGNADTRILLNGTKEQIYNEVKRCMDIGKSCPGFFMAVGNHIPANTPVENALYYNEVYKTLGRR